MGDLPPEGQPASGDPAAPAAPAAPASNELIQALRTVFTDLPENPTPQQVKERAATAIQGVTDGGRAHSQEVQRIREEYGWADDLQALFTDRPHLHKEMQSIIDREFGPAPPGTGDGERPAPPQSVSRIGNALDPSLRAEREREARLLTLERNDQFRALEGKIGRDIPIAERNAVLTKIGRLPGLSVSEAFYAVHGERALAGARADGAAEREAQIADSAASAYVPGRGATPTGPTAPDLSTPEKRDAFVDASIDKMNLGDFR